MLFQIHLQNNLRRINSYSCILEYVYTLLRYLGFAITFKKRNISKDVQTKEGYSITCSFFWVSFPLFRMGLNSTFHKIIIFLPHHIPKITFLLDHSNWSSRCKSLRSGNKSWLGIVAVYFDIANFISTKWNTAIFQTLCLLLSHNWINRRKYLFILTQFCFHPSVKWDWHKFWNSRTSNLLNIFISSCMYKAITFYACVFWLLLVIIISNTSLQTNFYDSNFRIKSHKGHARNMCSLARI